MRRAVALAALGVVLAASSPAGAATRRSSVGNYYFEDEATGDRSKLVADVGDQFTFTVRQGAATPHTVEVDELGIHSGDLRVGDTYTTPALTRAGTFNLYCRRHEGRGHNTRLIVRARVTPEPTRPPTPTPTARTTPALAPVTATPSVATPSASPTVSPSATLAPVGVGTAPPGSLVRGTPDPDSLEGLTGVARSADVPWTRAVWWLLILTVPIVAAAAFALWRNAVLHAAAVRAAADADAAQAAAAKRKPRQPSKAKRKPA